MSIHRKPNRKGQSFIDKRKDPEAKMIRAMQKSLLGGSKKKSKKTKKQESSDSEGIGLIGWIFIALIIFGLVGFFSE